MLTDRDALAARMFPREWAAVEHKVGASKKRQQLRQRAEQEVVWRKVKAELDAKGATCGNCRHCSPYPMSRNGELSCDLDTDFHGYAIVKPTHVCARWSEKS